MTKTHTAATEKIIIIEPRKILNHERDFCGMKYDDLLKTLRTRKEASDTADSTYFETLELLREVQEDVGTLEDEQHVRGAIKHFLIRWGHLGRVFPRSFNWEEVGNTLRGLKPEFNQLYGKPLLAIDFAEETVRAAVVTIYNQLKQIKHLGPTGIIKILHVLNPEVFILWDQQIRGTYPATADGYLQFAAAMQCELKEAIQDRQKITGVHFDAIIGDLRQEFSHKTMAKLCDEYNWVKTHQNDHRRPTTSDY